MYVKVFNLHYSKATKKCQSSIVSANFGWKT